MKIIRRYIYSAGALILITAIAKLISAGGSARLLTYGDPVLGIPYRDLFLVVGTIEAGVGFFCLFAENRFVLKACLTAWLATNFLIYRLDLNWIGSPQPCPCLGSLTGALHIPTQVADTGLKILLGYLLIGSYGALFWLWRQDRKNRAENPGTSFDVSGQVSKSMP